MRIQHNVAALNAQRYLSENNDAVAKNLEKLSSGYRINRAGDDAAGLSISEKMRAQITGLESARKNAQDGISLVQTAEGNLTEVHSMLNRMVELSTEAANGTYQELNRDEIQKEITSLSSEIDRISSSANFNGIKLLDGSLARARDPHITKAIVHGASATLVESNAESSAYLSQNITGGTVGKQTLTFSYRDEGGRKITKQLDYELTSNDGAQHAQAIIQAIKSDDTLNELFTTGNPLMQPNAVQMSSKAVGADAPQILSVTSTDPSLKTTSILKAVDVHQQFDIRNLQAGDSVTMNGKTYRADTKDVLVAELGKDGYLLQGLDASITIVAGPEAKAGLILQIGESNDDYQQTSVQIFKMDSKSLGLANLNLTNQADALKAIDQVNNAIDEVSAGRGDLGAIQNRLEHTVNNLSVSDENMTAAESRIRDVDMAKEMMNFTKNNILTQAAQSMLAQANTLPQGILQLLR